MKLQRYEIDYDGGATWTCEDGDWAKSEEVSKLEASHERLVNALKEIIAIPHEEFGGDWDEIDLAQEIAEMALVESRKLTKGIQ